MINRAQEERHLALADRHMAEGAERLARQQEIVERLRVAGCDTTQAERLFDNIAGLLNTARVHRLMILERLYEASE